MLDYIEPELWEGFISIPSWLNTNGAITINRITAHKTNDCPGVLIQDDGNIELTAIVFHKVIANQK